MAAITATRRKQAPHHDRSRHDGLQKSADRSQWRLRSRAGYSAQAGQKIADKRAENATSEGIVLVQVSEDGTTGKVVALACETEPVAKVEDFRKLAQRILDAAVRTNAATKEELLATKEADGLITAGPHHRPDGQNRREAGRDLRHRDG